MSERHMDHEEIIKGYDPVIMRRLVRFLRPYVVPVIGAVFALIISTTGDLLIPVVIQNAIDTKIIGTYGRLLDDDSYINDDTVFRIGDDVYVPDHRLVRTVGVDRHVLEQSGVLSPDAFHVFEIETAAHRDLIARYPDIFVVDAGTAAIEVTNFRTLSDAEKMTVRAADFAGLLTLVIGFLGILCAVLIFTFLQVYLMAYTGQGVMKDLRLTLFDHTVNQSISYLSRHPVGKLVTRMTNDVETINELFTNVLISLMRDVAMMVGVLLVLFLMNPRLALVAVLTLPPVIISMAFFRVRAREAYRRVRLLVSRVNAFLAEHISGISVVQIFANEDATRAVFGRSNSGLLSAHLQEMYVFAVFRPLLDLLLSVSIGVVVYYGASTYITGLVSLGVLIAFINLLRRFYQPVMDIAEKFTILQSAMAGSERVFQLLDEKERIPDEGTGRLRRVEGKIEFRSVSFSYKPGEPVLKNVSFTAQPGETIAIVGYTGAGKTTIASLLTRFWDIDSGNILLDGNDIRSIPLHELRTAIQPIQQDVFLFNETIRENIVLGAAVSETSLRHAVETAQAHHFIDHLPDGIDTHLEEGAVNISTGQRQLISFARIIANDPRVIIMDEATSSIDTETEVLIQKGMHAVLEGRTSLVIAHRLSTIKYSDKIIVLSNGEVVEQGTHDELIDRRGLYFNLYRLQYHE